MTIEQAIKTVVRETQAKNTIKNGNMKRLECDGFVFFVGKFSQPYFVLEVQAIGNPNDSLQILTEQPLTMVGVIEQYINTNKR